MFRPFPRLAAMLTLISIVFYIVAMATTSWLIFAEPNLQLRQGLFEECVTKADNGISECRHVWNSCDADFSPPVGTFGVTPRCAGFRAVRAFIIMATILAGVAFLCYYLSAHLSVPFIPLRVPGLASSVGAGTCGFIAWCIFVGISRSMNGNWRYGFSFGLAAAAWVLNFVSSVFACIPYPYGVRDTAELPGSTVRDRTSTRGGFMDKVASALGGREPTASKSGYHDKWSSYSATKADPNDPHPLSHHVPRSDVPEAPPVTTQSSVPSSYAPRREDHGRAIDSSASIDSRHPVGSRPMETSRPLDARSMV